MQNGAENREQHRRSGIAVFAAVIISAVIGIGLLPPIIEGKHLGYNSATDTRCETRLGIQWCGGSPPSETDGAVPSQSQAEREGAEAEGLR